MNGMMLDVNEMTDDLSEIRVDIVGYVVDKSYRAYETHYKLGKWDA